MYNIYIIYNIYIYIFFIYWQYIYMLYLIHLICLCHNWGTLRQLTGCYPPVSAPASPAGKPHQNCEGFASLAFHSLAPLAPAKTEWLGWVAELQSGLILSARFGVRCLSLCNIIPLRMAWKVTRAEYDYAGIYLCNSKEIRCHLRPSISEAKHQKGGVQPISQVQMELLKLFLWETSNTSISSSIVVP